MRVPVDPMVVVALGVEPGPDEARRWLREELLEPEYRGTDLVDRLARWFDELLTGAAEAPGSATAAAVLIGLGLLVALLWLATRARTEGGGGATTGPVLGEHALTAAQWLARARSALEAERYEDAVRDGFRAVAAQAAESGRIEVRPGLTAHEVAEALAADATPESAALVREGADLFDRVQYGGRPASRDQAGQVLGLAADPGGSRVESRP